MKETDIAQVVIAWLEAQGWDVYQEVQSRYRGGIADIVAVHGNLIWVVECKRSLSLSVLEQASRWRVHYRSVAVPASNRSQSRVLATRIAKDYLKIGIIEVSSSGCDERIAAPLMREHNRFVHLVRDVLCLEHKTFAQAGSKGGGYYTPYKATIEAIKRYLEEHPGATLKEIVDELGKRHYASTQSARSTFRLNLETIEANWCRVDKSERAYRYYIRET